MGRRKSTIFIFGRGNAYKSDCPSKSNQTRKQKKNARTRQTPIKKNDGANAISEDLTSTSIISGSANDLR